MNTELSQTLLIPDVSGCGCVQVKLGRVYHENPPAARNQQGGFQQGNFGGRGRGVGGQGMGARQVALIMHPPQSLPHPMLAGAVALEEMRNVLLAPMKWWKGTSSTQLLCATCN